MAATEQLKALVAQMPNPDDRQMFTQNIDKDKIEQAIAQIQQGGRDAILGVIDMLDTPGSVADVKPHYALHCLGNRALITKNEKDRREFCQTLAAELDSNRSVYIKSFLCQELQWAGRKESTAALGKLLLNEDLVEPATMALVAIKDGAADQLRAALPKAKGKCRLNILQGLAALEDPNTAGAFRDALRDEDREIRLLAGWGLSRLGQTDSVSPLLQAADTASGWERIQATKHCLVLAETLAAAGRKPDAVRIYRHLIDKRTEPGEEYLREAAGRGLQAIAPPAQV